jgi:hypothetical protein
MPYKNRLLLAIFVWSVLAGTQQRLPLAPYLLTQDDIKSVRGAEDIGEVIRKLRPCWLSFSYPKRLDFRPPNPCSFSLDFRATRPNCYVRLYLDNERIYAGFTDVGPEDVGEIRFYPPGTEWVIGDTVVHTGDCPTVHAVSIGAWYQFREHRIAVLTELERSATPIRLREVPVVLRPFGLSWDFEGARRLIFRLVDRPACGSIDLPARASSDTLSGPQRRALIDLLRCASEA